MKKINSKITVILALSNISVLTIYFLFEARIKEKYIYFSKFPHGRNVIIDGGDIINPEPIIGNGIYSFSLFIIMILSILNAIKQKEKKILNYIPIFMSIIFILIVDCLPKIIYYYSSLQYAK